MSKSWWWLHSVAVCLSIIGGINVVVSQRATNDGCYQQFSDSRVQCDSPYDKRSGMQDSQCRAMCNNNRDCRAVQYFGDSRSCHFFGRATSTRSKRDAIFHNLQKRAGPPCRPGLQRSSGHTYYASTGKCCHRPAPATQPPVRNDCPSGQVTRYYLVDGYQISGSPDFTFTAASEQACIDACTKNRLPDGRAATCKSFDYDTGSKKCSISLQATGVAQSDPPNPAIKHYEKTCVDAAFGQRCPGPYFRGPQRILVGFAQSVITASSASECLQICSNSQSRFGFTCSSIMYYYQDTNKENCILNSETRSTHPDLYVPENIDKVDYYEPGCTPARARRQTDHHRNREINNNRRNRNVLRLHSSDYSGWTMCDSVKGDHKRFRKCSTLNPNKCEMNKTTCSPNNEAQYDVPIKENSNTSSNNKSPQTTNSPTTTTAASAPSAENPDDGKPNNSGSNSNNSASSASSSSVDGNGNSTNGIAGGEEAGGKKDPSEEGQSSSDKGPNNSTGTNNNGDSGKGDNKEPSKQQGGHQQEQDKKGQGQGPEKMDAAPEACRPLIKPDGGRDCDHGMRQGKNGANREQCKPSKDECK